MNDLRKSFFRNNKLLYLLSLALSVASMIILIFFAYVAQRLLDVANKGSLEELKSVILFMFTLIAALLIVELLAKSIKAAFFRKAMYQYKNDAFSMITKKGISSFASEATNSYLSILTNDATYIEENYLSGSILIVVKLVSLFGGLAMMIYYSWIMTIAIILLCLIPIAVSVVVGNKLQAVEKEISEKNESFMGKIKDLLSGFFIIKSFHAEDTAIRLFKEENNELEREKQRRKNTEGNINAVSMVLSGSIQMSIFAVGAILAIKGQITLG